MLLVTLQKVQTLSRIVCQRVGQWSHKTEPWQSRGQRPQSIECCEGRVNNKIFRRGYPAYVKVFQLEETLSEEDGSCYRALLPRFLECS